MDVLGLSLGCFGSAHASHAEAHVVKGGLVWLSLVHGKAGICTLDP